MQCPSCKSSIDDDSFHCDQCGAEILQCGRCGHIGKGKRCPADGTPMLSRKAAASGAPVPPPPPPPLPPTPPGPGPSGPPALLSGSTPRLRLRSAVHGLDLTPASGAVLGRRLGPHADVLSRFSQISSSHLELQQRSDGRWVAKDLNSFNHSFLNERQLIPGVEQPLAAGDTLSLGDVALSVLLE